MDIILIMPFWKRGGTETSNQTPAPKRRPRFPLGAQAELDYLFYAPSASPAAVGEAQR